MRTVQNQSTFAVSCSQLAQSLKTDKTVREQVMSVRLTGTVLVRELLPRELREHSVQGSQE